MANAYLEEITLPSGTVYDLHDKRVDNLNNWSYEICTSASNTPYGVTWDNAGTTVTGTLVASASTLNKIYLVPRTNGTNNTYDEYITVKSGSTYSWEKFGSTDLPDMNNYVKNASGHSGDTAGALAYKNSASGSVNIPSSFSFTNGSASAQTFTGTGVRLVTDTEFATGVSNSSFTGTQGSVSVSGTTAGSVSESKSKVEVEVASSGTANYTPAGSVSVSVSSAGSTTTIKNPTAKTVVTDMSVANAGATATGELVYMSVSGTNLSFKKLIETTGDSITTTNTTVKTGDASYSGSFSGTGVKLQTKDNVLTGASFQGSSMTSTGNFTPSGGISVTLSKSASTVSPASSGTATYTPAGTNSTSSVTGSVGVAGSTPTTVTVS